MAEKDQSHQPTHRAYSVIKREGQDDFWLNLGLAFPHKEGKGFNIMLQAYRTTSQGPDSSHRRVWSTSALRCPGSLAVEIYSARPWAIR
jgi:hypothetical protein